MYFSYIYTLVMCFEFEVRLIVLCTFENLVFKTEYQLMDSGILSKNLVFRVTEYH
jgi:hypothetical protein